LNSPVFNYPYERTRQALFALSRGGDPDPHLGHLMRYVNPVDGGWAMPTMATMIRLLPQGFSSRPYRSTDGMIFVAVEGREGRFEVLRLLLADACSGGIAAQNRRVNRARSCVDFRRKVGLYERKRPLRCGTGWQQSPQATDRTWPVAR
jgi:hypothetical protein